MTALLFVCLMIVIVVSANHVAKAIDRAGRTRDEDD